MEHDLLFGSIGNLLTAAGSFCSLSVGTANISILNSHLYGTPVIQPMLAELDFLGLDTALHMEGATTEGRRQLSMGMKDLEC